jgi:hypothetical protein
VALLALGAVVLPPVEFGQEGMWPGGRQLSAKLPPAVALVRSRRGGRLGFPCPAMAGGANVALLDPAVLLEEDSDLFLGQVRVDAADEEVGVFVAWSSTQPIDCSAVRMVTVRSRQQKLLQLTSECP